MGPTTALLSLILATAASTASLQPVWQTFATKKGHVKKARLPAQVANENNRLFLSLSGKPTGASVVSFAVWIAPVHEGLAREETWQLVGTFSNADGGKPTEPFERSFAVNDVKGVSSARTILTRAVSRQPPEVDVLVRFERGVIDQLQVRWVSR